MQTLLRRKLEWLQYQTRQTSKQEVLAGEKGLMLNNESSTSEDIKLHTNDKTSKSI